MASQLSRACGKSQQYEGEYELSSIADQPSKDHDDPVPVTTNNGQESGTVVFAHPSEKEFAAILDYYGIRWEYEPTSFPLQWHGDRVLEMFTPDFYLPDLDLYVELTTMRQSLVTKKNRKLRRLRELYPNIKIKLLYRRDYLHLVMKYGLARIDNI